MPKTTKPQQAVKKRTEKTDTTIKTVKARWPASEAVIPYANAFKLIYDAESAMLLIGLLEPEYQTLGPKQIPDEVDIRPLARFFLTPQSLLRLKSNVDETYEGMKAKGAFNE